MLQHTRRSFRGLVIAAFAAAAVALSGGSALAAHQVSQSGSPGAWDLPDSAANPSSRCGYNGGGVLGGTYLTSIKLIQNVEIFGTSGSKRSVAYRLIIQHKQNGSWHTVKKGTLVSGQATSGSAAVLPPTKVSFGALKQPKNPFRAQVKMIWYAADASVQGTRIIALDSYVQRDLGVGSKCKGFVSDF